MIGPRRFLPSIHSLLALEAVDRLGSASAAARELALTQSAVSRQLKALEEQLGVQLVLRTGLRLQLTPAGREYVATARSSLQRLAQASLKLKANPTGGSLNLSILPAFGMHWLAPRLRGFAMLHPEVSVNLSTRLQPFDFATEPFDAAIHFGRRDWSGVAYLAIMREEVVPVCAPSMIPPGGAAALMDAPLLHLDTRPDAWEQWFRAQGVSPGALRGMLFDQFSTMIQATVHGLGVALLPGYLVERDIRKGRLVVASDGPRVSLGDYYLVWPQNRGESAPLVSFRTWLSTQI